MASTAYTLMRELYSFGQMYRAEDNFVEAQVMDICESFVNSKHHGRPASEWMPEVYQMINTSISNRTDEAEKSAFNLAAEVVQGVARRAGITL